MTKRQALNKINFPFTELVGQTQAQLALLLCAIDPLLGGVLIEGGRGSAKSTMARGLAPLIGEVPFVDLPLGASEEQLIGSLDLERVLNDKKVSFRPGLLAKANNGILYVDEVNLLPDHLVDLLLDVAASGINTVERDGISHKHDAQFVLIGTMNPDEGELRPQLIDRFGLCATVNDKPDEKTRQTIVQKRLAFDLDNMAFIESCTEQEMALSSKLNQVCQHLQNITYSETAIQQATSRCASENVEGVRADLSLLRAARAYAALCGDTDIESQHIDAVAELALRHRRKPSQNESPKPQSNRPPASRMAPPSSDNSTKGQQPDGDQSQGPGEQSSVETGAPINISEYLEKKY